MAAQTAGIQNTNLFAGQFDPAFALEAAQQASHYLTHRSQFVCQRLMRRFQN